MKKLLVVLVVAVAMLLVGCPQPAGSSIPDEMTVTSVDLISNGTSSTDLYISLNDETTIAELLSTMEEAFALYLGTTINLKWSDNKIVADPAVTVNKATLDEKIKQANDFTGELSTVSYEFTNGHFVLKQTF